MERLMDYTFIVFLCMLLSCQTLGQNKSIDVKVEEDAPMNVNLGQQFVGRKEESVIPTNTTSSLFMEGGSVNKSSTQVSIPEKKVIEPTNLLNPDPALPEEMVASWPGGHDKNSSSKPRKGAPTCSCCVNITTEEQLKNCSCCPADFTITPTTFPVIVSTIKSTTSPSKIPKTESTTLSSNNVSAASTSKVAVVQPTPVVHHKKPNVTADAPDPQVPAQQEDYVIPVVGIIFAIPLIIILGALVYKKGADLWERRHYRRMDFLIDGIYNQ